MKNLRPPEPTAVVIFGASGDLTSRKLLPGLYHLFHEGLLPEAFAVVGYARSGMSDGEFRSLARKAVEIHGRCDIEEDVWSRFAERLSYVAGEFADERAMEHLVADLRQVDEAFGTQGRRLFYCATPPAAYPDIVRRIGEEGMQEVSRIIIEKPFGEDLASARELDEVVHSVFVEEQVFRIDHYLGKETVQNILVLRFANALLEPVWNNKYVDHVQLSVAEDIGIEGRGRFYERTGALRDVVQTHLLQMLTFLTMEPPASLDPERLRDEKVKVLRAMRPLRVEDVVRGQYRGYRDEDNVRPDSDVETFVALRLSIEDWRWAGVPFFLRAGKRMAEKRAEAHIVFHGVPHLLFEGHGVERMEPNRLIVRIQPDAGVSVVFTVQRPGVGIDLDRATMDFDYGTAFDTPLVEAYEVLLLEAMRGDHTMFTRYDGVERAWEVVQPVLDAPPPTVPYEAGSWGPKEADELIAPRRWLAGR